MRKPSPSQNVLVCVRMPKTLVEDFKNVAATQHYLDLSEALRSVLRKRWLQYQKPQAYELKLLREDISESIKNSAVKQDERSFIKKLDRIKKILEEGE